MMGIAALFLMVFVGFWIVRTSEQNTDTDDDLASETIKTETAQVSTSQVPSSTSESTERATLEPEITATETSFLVTETPAILSPTATIEVLSTVVPTELTSQLTPVVENKTVTVFVDITGSPENIEFEGNQVQFKIGEGVVVVNSEDFAGFLDALDQRLTMSGAITEEGFLAVDTMQLAEATEVDTCMDESIPAEAPCQPVLVVLADVYGISYEGLLILNENGYGVGELTQLYTIAQTADIPVSEVMNLRGQGLSWEAITESYPQISEETRRNGVIIGNGRGQSVRSGNVQPPVQQNQGNGQGNQGQGNQGQGNGQDQGNQGQGNSQGQGNGNGNQGQGNSNNGNGSENAGGRPR
jgi:hypothetical protein